MNTVLSMRRMLLLLVLSLALPLSAWAGLALPAQPCPMAKHFAHSQDGCCTEMDAASKLCKSDSQCKSAKLIQTPATLIARASITLKFPPAPPIAVHERAGEVWRPPQLG